MCSSQYGLPWWLSTKESACKAGDASSIWVGKIPWRRAWQPTLALLPRGSHAQRSPEGRSPWGRTELNTAEATQQQQ